MSYLTASSCTFEPLPDGIIVGPAHLDSGDYYDVGMVGTAPAAGQRMYDDAPVTFVGIDGVAHIRKGFRGMPIYATLVFAGSVNQCHTRCKNALDALSQQARYSVGLPDGATFQGCKLQNVGVPSWRNVSGGCLLFVPVTFIQLSDTN
ncbi:MAG TPA: hypothetical protein VGP72_10500 [Planctomycetota bacterium]